MSIKNVTVIGLLIVAVIFLTLDKCGNSRKADELRGQYEEASQTAKVERLIKEEIIKKQKEKIAEAESTIATLNENVAKKDKGITELGNTVTELEDEFGSLIDKDEKIANLVQQVGVWKDKFSISQDIISDKDAIIFSLTQKYESQVVISDSYKTMYDTLTLNTKKLEQIVTVQDWQIKRLKLTGGLKTGIVLGLAGLIVFNVLK